MNLARCEKKNMLGFSSSDNGNRQAQPFLKWAGGKKGLLSELRKLVPSSFKRYMEPFLGGGALFFDLHPKHAIISDSNGELINAYKVVRDSPEDLIKQLEVLPVSGEMYYRMREIDPASMNDVQRGARLIYLNKTCYNGLYRVNKKGRFNTPYGRNRTPSICRPEIILRASKALRRAVILSEDFERVLLQEAKAGDFIYLDPPYPPAGGYADFVRYTSEFFKEEDHLRLAKVVEEIDDRGCSFVLSNAKHPLIQEIYSRFRKIEVRAPRFVNCRGDRRGHVPEVLITNA